MMVVMAARRGRPTAPVELSGEERQTLERWARRPCTTQSLAMRTQIVLACAEGKTNRRWPGRWAPRRRRCASGAVAFSAIGWRGWPMSTARECRPRSLSEMVERVLIKTLEEKPRDATHWSTRGMAKQVGLSRSSVQRIWHTFELQPHRTDTFKISNDPLFVDKVWDITGLYLNPPEAAAVLCVDEKSQIQALDRTQPIVPMRPGLPERRTHDSNVMAPPPSYPPSPGQWKVTEHPPQASGGRVQEVPGARDQQVPAGLGVHLVLDNTAPTRRPRSRSGCSGTLDSNSTSRPPTRRG